MCVLSIVRREYYNSEYDVGGLVARIVVEIVGSLTSGTQEVHRPLIMYTSKRITVSHPL